MIVDIDVPAVEIARPVLHVRFGGPRRPHLGTLVGRLPAGPTVPSARRQGDGRVRGRGRRVVIGILAASHQVLLDGEVVETVSCDDPRGRAVGDGTEVEHAGLRFRSTVAALDGPAFRAAVDRLVADARTGATALAARFPNDPHAVTAVALADRGWRTVHTYPTGERGVLVTTETALVVRS